MWYELGQWLVQRTDSAAGRILFVAIPALGGGACEAIFHLWVIRVLPRENMGMILDAFSVAVLMGVIAYIGVSALHARRQRLLAEVRMVAELNHRVRNALQTIAYAARLPEAGNQVQIIEECIQRIDLTLRELVPAKNTSVLDTTPTVTRSAN